MKQKWSASWKGSKQPRKQRKYRFNAPLHLKRKFLSVHLSRDLRVKYSRRALPIRTGDKVKISIGTYRGRSGKIDHVNLKQSKVYVVGIEKTKKDGSKIMFPIHPSNVMITELMTGDKKRDALLTRTVKKA